MFVIVLENNIVHAQNIGAISLPLTRALSFIYLSLSVRVSMWLKLSQIEAELELLGYK